jgi:hypothetical protein
MDSLRHPLRVATRSYRPVRFVGQIEWGAADQLPASSVPEAFRTAKRLWDRDPLGNSDEIRDLLRPLARAVFLPGILFDVDQLLPLWSNEIEATELEILAVDFSNGAVPRIRAVAEFEIPIISTFDLTTLGAWEREHDYLARGLSFEWKFDVNGFSAVMFKSEKCRLAPLTSFAQPGQSG